MAEDNKTHPRGVADAQDKLESSKTHARKAAEDLRSAAGSVATEYRDKAEQAWDDARDRVRTFQDDAEQYVLNLLRAVSPRRIKLCGKTIFQRFFFALNIEKNVAVT